MTLNETLGNPIFFFFLKNTMPLTLIKGRGINIFVGKHQNSVCQTYAGHELVNTIHSINSSWVDIIVLFVVIVISLQIHFFHFHLCV